MDIVNVHIRVLVISLMYGWRVGNYIYIYIYNYHYIYYIYKAAEELFVKFTCESIAAG